MRDDQGWAAIAEQEAMMERFLENAEVTLPQIREALMNDRNGITMGAFMLGKLTAIRAAFTPREAAIARLEATVGTEQATEILGQLLPPNDR